jgi:asparagine synthase (glutamine-hydrolysing)
MCGIAGVVGPHQMEPAESLLRAMVGAIAHRGPDGEGIESWPGAMLGHRRLAIIDLSDAGRQPMLSEDRQVGVVFNGCIYNFVEVRKQLEAHGHVFRSQCDTEVLVRGYEQWGIDQLVPKLRGMFAFALWDNRRRKLFLVRDRLGVKPLIYCAGNGLLAFASTVTALRAAGLVEEIDPQAVLEYLEFGCVVGEERTIFRGACKLPPATILEWQDGKVGRRSYWSLPAADETAKITFAEAVEETQRLLVESVRLRLIADVPIGALLSGGIDSTLVCWAVTKLNADLTAFTVSTPGDEADEGPQTVETARRLGIRHQMVTLPREQASLIQEVTDAYGEPFGCSSALAMLRVSEAVKPLATVLLTGDGGDDVFLGYAYHQYFWMAERLARRLPELALPLWQSMRPLIEVVPALRRPQHFLDFATGGLGAVTRAHDGLPYYERLQLLGGRLAGMPLVYRQIPWSMGSARRLLGDFLDYQQKMWFVAEYLAKVDGGTMYHALEARSPFLDHVLWEFAAALPYRLRLRGGTLKAILREIVRRQVGAEIAARPKQGFTIPVEQWLASHWSAALQEISQESLLEQSGWIRSGGLGSAVERALAARSVPKQLWYLLVLEHWLRRNAEMRPLAAAGSVPPPSAAVHR